MRMNVTTSNFTDAAKAGFLSPSPSYIAGALDEVIPLSCGIRDFIDRGQAFGLLSKNIAIDLNIPIQDILIADNTEHLKKSHLYHSAVLRMDISEGAEIKGKTPKTLSIYKDISSGLFYFGVHEGNLLKVDGHAMDGKEMAVKVMDWSMAFANDNPSKQRPYLNTVTFGKSLPGEALRTVKAVANELAAYWRKTLG